MVVENVILLLQGEMASVRSKRAYIKEDALRGLNCL